MNPKALLAGFDLTKLSLNSLSGLIVMTSLLFFIDAGTSANLSSEIFDEVQAGVLAGLIFVVGAAVAGLLVDSIFHTFGRWHAEGLWPPIAAELTYREQLMQGLGLTKDDFEWVRMTVSGTSKENSGAGKEGTGLAKDVEAKFMRFVEVAGASAYALLLLSPATALYLSRQYHEDDEVSLGAAYAIAAAAVVLMVTSAAALGRYEQRKTAAALDEIRKLRTPAPTRRRESAWDWATDLGRRLWALRRSGRQWRSLWGTSLARFAMLVAALMLAVGLGTAASISAWRLVEESETKESDMMFIGKIADDGNPATLELNVTMTGVTPGNVSGSLLVEINDKIRDKLNLTLKDGTKKSGTNLAEKLGDDQKPPWKLFASIEDAKDVTGGDFVAVNAFLSFDGGAEDGCTEPTAVEAGQISCGTWLFPVVVTDDSSKREHVLAYVRVSITKGGFPGTNEPDDEEAGDSSNEAPEPPPPPPPDEPATDG